MAKRRNIVPYKFVDFNVYITLVLPYIITNAARLLINQANIVVLQTLIEQPDNGWNDLYALHSTGTTQTKPVNNKIKACQFSITKMLQIIYNDILRSIMTTEDYMVLNITIPKGIRTKRGLITSMPTAFLNSIGGGIIKFKVRWDTDTGRASMAPLADAIRVMGMILKPGDALPTDPQQCTITFTSKRAVFNHIFSLKEAGNRFVCFLQYVNQSDESKNGPVSVLHTCIIGL